MYNDAQLLELRVDRFVRERLLPQVERATAPVAITAWEVPDEPVPFAHLDLKAFAPFQLGQPWGHAWGTVWFRLIGTVRPPTSELVKTSAKGLGCGSV